jgi:hypothetical protein
MKSLLADYGIPRLTLEQVAELCEEAEQSARDYILSQISKGKIVTLDVTVYAEGTKPVAVNVEVNLVLSPIMKGFNVKELTKEATNQAFVHIEEYLRKLKCKSKK